ncbi:TPA: helix-turn-helix domain-containing protein [Staphylococcus aureus]|nr:helix-turn-helix domain-containing protein [Staphylococcus aureus]
MIRVNLKRILKERKITLKELSNEIGISTNALSSFQNQKTESVYYPTIEAITSYLNIEVGDLIEKIDEYYELVVDISHSQIEEKKFNKAYFHLNGVNHDYRSTIEFYFSYSFKSLHSLEIEIDIEFDKWSLLPEKLHKIIWRHDMTNKSEGIFWVLSNLLIQELVLKKKFAHLNITSEILVNLKKVPLPLFKKEKVPKEISKNDNRIHEFIFRETCKNIFLVPYNGQIDFEPNNPPKGIKYIPYFEQISVLEFIAKLEKNEKEEKVRVFIK